MAHLSWKGVPLDSSQAGRPEEEHDEDDDDQEEEGVAEGVAEEVAAALDPPEDFSL